MTGKQNFIFFVGLTIIAINFWVSGQFKILSAAMFHGGTTAIGLKSANTTTAYQVTNDAPVYSGGGILNGGSPVNIFSGNSVTPPLKGIPA